MLGLPLLLFALRAMAAGQSALAPDAEVPGVREPPVESGTPDDGPPKFEVPVAPEAPVEPLTPEVPVGPLMSEVPVGPLTPELDGVFGSTGLPVPSVRELCPGVVGDAG